MGKIKITNGNGDPVEVLQAKYDSTGALDSVLVRDGQYEVWRHAAEFNVIDDGTKPGENSKTVTKEPVAPKPTTKPLKTVDPGTATAGTDDAQIKPGETVTK